MNGIFIWTDFGADYGDTGGSLALNYHHLFFNENHSWGSYFGIGGCYDTVDSISLPAFAYGLYLNHPTLAQNAYDRLGSRTDSYHRIDSPYESLSFHTGGVVYAPYTKTELGLFLWSDDDIPAGNRLRSSPHIIKEVEAEYLYGQTIIGLMVMKNIVLRTEHHPIHYVLYTDRLAVGGSVFTDPSGITLSGIFCQEPAICSYYPSGADYILGSLNLNTIINAPKKDTGYYVSQDHGEKLLQMVENSVMVFLKYYLDIT